MTLNSNPERYTDVSEFINKFEDACKGLTTFNEYLGIDHGTGAAEFSATIKTGNPTGGTAAAWKLGSRVAATVVVNTTQYIEVDIGGTLYKLATVT